MSAYLWRRPRSGPPTDPRRQPHVTPGRFRLGGQDASSSSALRRRDADRSSSVVARRFALPQKGRVGIYFAGAYLNGISPRRRRGRDGALPRGFFP